MRITTNALFLLVAVGVPANALAQTSPGPLPFMPPVQTTKVEVSVGLSINSLSLDLNEEPTCRSEGRPCSHAPSTNNFGGFGFDTTVAINQSDRRAFVVAGHMHAHPWVSGEPSRNDYDWEKTTTVLAGQSWHTEWIVIPGLSSEPARFYVNALGGLGHSTGMGTRAVVQVGAGVDGIMRRQGRYGPPVDVTLRMSFDYRFTPAQHADIRGAQFGIALVIGPHR